MNTFKLEHVLKCAKEMTTDEYINYCDTIENVELARQDCFGAPSRIIRLENFYWPHWMELQEYAVYGYQEPGAYITVYDIFAVNRKTRVAWSLYADTEYMLSRTEENCLLPQEKLEPICNAMQDILDQREKEYQRRRSEWKQNSSSE